MCNVCMCETIDALGLAGFNKDFNTIEAITQGQQADLLHVRLQMFLCNVCLSQKSALQLVSNRRFCLLCLMVPCMFAMMGGAYVSLY